MFVLLEKLGSRCRVFHEIESILYHRDIKVESSEPEVIKSNAISLIFK